MIRKTSLALILTLLGLTSYAKKGKTPTDGGPLVSSQSFALPGLVLKTNDGVYQETNFDLDLMTYHFTMPPDHPTAPGDPFAVLLNGKVPAGAPTISEFTRQASPDRSFVLQGARFTARNSTESESDTRLWIYSQTTSENGTLSSVSLLQENAAAITGLIAPTEPYGMYLVWAENADGTSYPVRINATEAWWVGPNHGTTGSAVSIYGRNLSQNNGETASYVYLRPWGEDASAPSTAAEVTAVNPYKVTFTVPAGLPTNRDYEVWVHNGHGGDYGWSGPLKLYVEGISPYAWAGTTRDVINYGATPNDSTDDTTAIQTALDAAENGDIVRFPAGKFLISRPLSATRAISIEGAGSAVSVLEVTPASFPHLGILHITGFPSRVRTMGFSSLVTRDIYPLGGFVFFDGEGQTPTKSGAFVENCSFKAASGSRHTSIGTRSINDVRVINSVFTAGWALHVYGSYQVFFQNNIIDGNWPDRAEGSEQAAVSCQASNEVDASGNSGKSLDRSANKTLSRFWIAQGHGHGVTSHHYIADNETRDTGCALGPCGEQIMFEAPGTFFTGRPSTLGDTTITFPGVSWKRNYFAEDDRTAFTDYDERRPSVIFVQSGEGEGQYRRILSNTSNTVTIDRPWDITPNTNSVLTFITTSYRSVVYRNRLNGFANVFGNSNFTNVGIVTFGSQFDLIAAGNLISTLRVGIEISSLTHNSCVCKISGRPVGDSSTNNCPSWGILIVDNQVSNTLYGVVSWSRVEVPPRSETGPLVLGSVIRDNKITESRKAGLMVGDINRFWIDGVWQRNAVIEYNQVTDAKIYLELLGLQTDTVVRQNVFTDNNVYSETSGIVVDTLCREPHFYDNRFDRDIDIRYNAPGSRRGR